jgi:hypothetical protein
VLRLILGEETEVNWPFCDFSSYDALWDEGVAKRSGNADFLCAGRAESRRSTLLLSFFSLKFWIEKMLTLWGETAFYLQVVLSGNGVPDSAEKNDGTGGLSSGCRTLRLATLPIEVITDFKGASPVLSHPV